MNLLKCILGSVQMKFRAQGNLHEHIDVTQDSLHRFLTLSNFSVLLFSPQYHGISQVEKRS